MFITVIDTLLKSERLNTSLIQWIKRDITTMGKNLAFEIIIKMVYDDKPIHFVYGMQENRDKVYRKIIDTIGNVTIAIVK